MNIEDNENFYVLEEEEKDDDQTPMNFAAYSHEEALEEEEKEKDGEEIEKTSGFGLLMRVMFNPVEGWKSIRRSRLSPEELQSGIFYPILAILAVTSFADYFYSVNVGLSQLVTEAIISFVAFFFGYFLLQMVLSWILPKDMAKKFESKYGKVYCLVSLSTLALFSTLINLLPMLWPILIFLPIWTLYIMFKGVRFFHFAPNQEMKFFVLSGAASVGVPLLLDWGITSLLPY